VDLGDLETDDKELVFGFLRSSLKVDVVVNGNKASVDSRRSSPEELKRLVNKFIYRKNLNHRYWVALKEGVVKVHKFKRTEKQKKRRREGTSPSIITHGW
jgi:hypothetical protein